MRLLIDECVDVHLRLLFPGDLLGAAEAACFDVLVTVDQNIPDSAEPRRTADFFGNSVRTNEPAARLGAIECLPR